MSVGNVIVAGLVLTISYGWLTIWAIISWGLGFLILSKHAGVIVSAASNYPTIHRFIKVTTGSSLLSKMTSLLTLITACGIIALELMVGSAIFSSSFGIGDISRSTVLCVLVLAIVVVIYTRAGGLSAIIRTDKFQSYALFTGLLCLVTLTYFGQTHDGAFLLKEAVAAQLAEEPSSHQLFSLIGYVFGFGALQLFLLLGDMTTWQRIQLGADVETVVKASKKAAFQNVVGWSLILAAGFFLLNWNADAISLPVVTGSIDEVLISQAEPLNSILNFGFSFDPIISAVLIFILTFGIVSAILSTCDSFLLISVQTFLFEWTSTGRTSDTVSTVGEEDSELKTLRSAKRLVPIMMLVSLSLLALVVYLSIPLVAVIFLLLSAQTAIAPIAIAALYYGDRLKNTGTVLFMSLLVTLITIGGLFVLSGTATSISMSYAYSYVAPIAALTIPIVTIFLCGLLMKNKRPLLRLPIDMIFPKG